MDHFWSLAVEEQFYLLWPLVILFSSSRRFVTLIGLLMLSLVVALSLPIMGFQYGFFSRLPIGGCSFALLLGAFIAHKVFPSDLHKQKRYQRLFFILGVPVFIATVVMWKRHYGIEGISTWYLSLVDISYALIGALLITSVLCNRKFAAVIDNPILAYVGMISYGLYVYHLMLESVFPWLFQVVTVAPPGFDFVFYQFVLKTFVAIIVASISWYVFERKILSLRDKFSKK